MRREDILRQFSTATDEQIKALLDINSADIGNALGRQRAELETATANAAALQQQLDTLTADLTAARNNAANVAQLRADLDAAQAKIKASAKSNAIRDALARHKPRDPAMLARLLDNEKIVHGEDGSLSGLEEQVEQLKKDSGYLFFDAPDDRGGSSGGGNGGAAFDMNKFLRGEQ